MLGAKRSDPHRAPGKKAIDEKRALAADAT